jgi:hypothetical protein
LHDALTIDDTAQATLPCCQDDAVGQGAKSKLANRCGLQILIVSKHQRHWRIKLAKSTQHPIHALFFVVALNAHSLKELDRHIDLPLSMNTLIFFLVRKVPHMRLSSQRIFRISFANFI